MSPSYAIASTPALAASAAETAWKPSPVAVIAVTVGLLVVGLIAFMVSPKLGVVALGLPLAPLLVLAPDKMVLLVIAALPFDAVASIGPPGTFTITRTLGFAVVGGWIVNVLVLRRRLIIGSPGYLLAGFVVFAIASTFWSVDFAATTFRLRTLVQLFLFYLMIVNLLRTPHAIERALDVLLFASAIVALIVLWQFPSVEAVTRATIRYGEQKFDQNYLAMTLVLPALAAIALGRGSARFGWWRWAAVVVGGVAIVITGSRGGILAMVVGLAALGAARPRIGLRAAAALVLIASAVVLVAPSSYIDRLTARYSSVGSDRLSGRLDIWKVAVAVIADHPLRGTGFSAFPTAFVQYVKEVEVDPQWALTYAITGKATHNTFISVVAELGAIGGALLFAALAAHALSGWKAALAAWRADFQASSNLALAALTALIGLLVMAMSLEVVLNKMTWFVLATVQAVAFCTWLPGSQLPGQDARHA